MGNSMPIRDLDMYAAPGPAAAVVTSAAAAAVQGVVPVALGARVAANRGASGIDGVLSTGGWQSAAMPALCMCGEDRLAGCASSACLRSCTCCVMHPLTRIKHPSSIACRCPAAAGFADGLGRGATLVVGDLSFLHDINGLNLLRSGVCVCVFGVGRPKRGLDGGTFRVVHGAIAASLHLHAALHPTSIEASSEGPHCLAVQARRARHSQLCWSTTAAAASSLSCPLHR